VRLFPVTADDGIDVHVSASYLPYFSPFYNFFVCLIFKPFLILFCFFTFSFLMIFLILI
jgi:hypothetical protein